MKLGILVGLKAEATLIKAAFPDAAIAVSGATAAGAARGLQALQAAGVTHLLSFGCAGGLSPDLKVGVIINPARVLVDGVFVTCDPYAAYAPAWAAFAPQRSDLFHSDVTVTRAVEKKRLWQQTGCEAVDMESGIVARAGLPFNVLRVICDTAHEDLPPAVESIMAHGGISPLRVMKSLLRRPGQVPDLVRLGLHAMQARCEIKKFLNKVPSGRTLPNS